MSTGLKILLMGTGEFALPTFSKFCGQSQAGSPYKVVAVVTQPDRTGTGHHQHAHPIREMAESFGVEVYQPEKVNSPESLEKLVSFGADLFIVAAYGQILSGKLLAIPPHGAINLHGSLLPKYRGAAPVQYAVWKGEAETGVTIFQIQPKLDAGPMLGVVRTPIGFHETSGEVHDRLAEHAVPLTVDVVEKIAKGNISPILQNQQEVTLAPKIKKEEGEIDWSLSAIEIHNHIRAMQPWPKAYTHWKDTSNKDSSGKIHRLVISSIEITDKPAGLAPGTVEFLDKVSLMVATRDKLVKLHTVQPAGKKMMNVRDFLNGTSLTQGTFFIKETST